MKAETSVQGFNEFSMFEATFEVSPVQKSCLSIFQKFFLEGKGWVFLVNLKDLQSK